MDSIDFAQFTTHDHLNDVPALTTLLYKVCDNDDNKFAEACRLLRLFMEEVETE